MTVSAPAYPFGLDVDPAASQSRLTILFRIILAIPHLLIVGVLGALVQVLVILSWFVIIVTGRMPASFASLILNTLHWAARVNAYTFLLTGRYPPFAFGPDAAYPVRFWGEAQLEGRSRLTVFLRLILVIPHYLVLYILQIIANILLFIGWVVGIFIGRIPGAIHNYLAGYYRWTMRVAAYMALLTDRYPPFSLS
ncbi:DUF4389 domain-containing protein [Tepidiforma sp.]|uniref:DUF4389 domain-containing protein n=1 Tax=Tepidiforma sp. TaxID=2682230 RepID=UPI002ADD86A4|nr:DUF4389 domain-containing protein [Tepidiforma sp.]